MKTVRFIGVVIATAMVVGCAAPTKYSWGNYDRSLYSYYKDTTQSEAHLAELASIIQTAENTKAKVAPGLHAEYGYFLMQAGKSDQAVVQFEKEKTAWPESTQLMNSMIKMASAKTIKPLASKE